MKVKPWMGKMYVKEGNLYPATYISWDSCQEFMKRLNVKENGDNYRLPTEMEWEHACRAGNTTKYCYGNDVERLVHFAWYKKNACDVGEKYAHKVGRKKPNNWGLHDMHGNVYEWCQEKSLTARTNRGGSWLHDASYCESSSRAWSSPILRYDALGFRLVRSSD